MTVIFFIIAAVCAIGWLTRYVSCAAMIYYMDKKGYKLPNDEEIKECTRYVVSNLLKANQVEP